MANYDVSPVWYISLCVDSHDYHSSRCKCLAIKSMRGSTSVSARFGAGWLRSILLVKASSINASCCWWVCLYSTKRRLIAGDITVSALALSIRPWSPLLLDWPSQRPTLFSKTNIEWKRQYQAPRQQIAHQKQWQLDIYMYIIERERELMTCHDMDNMI